MSALPTLFVSHGAPTFALDPGRAGAGLGRVGARLPRPAAILVVSAHWETGRPAVSLATRPDTIHDFHGFPEPLYRLRYPAPGAPALATRTHELLTAAGFDCDADSSQGLDHGAWVPLMHLYPDADIPVTQLSIQTHLGPEHHWALGQALTPLTRENVLVIGSGSMTHNLREFRRLPEDSGEAPYVHDFREWLAGVIGNRDYAALLRYRTAAPEAARAHPTEDHFLPLFVALGAAAEGERHARLHDGVTFGVIGMDNYLFAAERAPDAATSSSDAGVGVHA